MTSSSLTDSKGIILRSLISTGRQAAAEGRRYAWCAGGLFVAALSCALLSGCIADTAEDSDLPWASNKNWEGIAPIAPTLMDQYE